TNPGLSAFGGVRYDRNGNIDRPNGVPFSDLGFQLFPDEAANVLLLQPDGAIVVGGYPGLIRLVGDPPVVDSVLVQPPGFTVSIPAGRTSATGLARLVVRNADPVQTLHAIKVSVVSSTCPMGVTVGTPDFDLRAAGAQDTYPIGGLRSRVAFVPITVSRDAVTTVNYRAAFRCHITFNVTVPAITGTDATPSNDTATLELNVRDFNDQPQSAPMESYVLSANPVQVAIGRALLYGQRFAVVVVGSADTYPTNSSGHNITVTATDGTCPAGTVGPVNFKLGVGNTVKVPGAQLRVGLLPIAVNRNNFTTNGVLSPSRCVANLAITTPATDTGPTNNTTNLVIDVIDLNDF
ncbi:MAG TPA: hypothetical protein VL403_11370, partial [Candidatus Kryptonia bacterium]|nr:hypothetical protein [Candidatus Kryptonia bacterium]